LPSFFYVLIDVYIVNECTNGFLKAGEQLFVYIMERTITCKIQSKNTTPLERFQNPIVIST